MKPSYKKILIIPFFALFLFMISCGNGKIPAKVAENFMNFVEREEFEKAKELGTENTRQILETLQTFQNLDNQFGEGQEPKPREIHNMVCEIDGDHAKCTYSVDDEKGSIDLVMEDGEWLVDMKKESFGE